MVIRPFQTGDIGAVVRLWNQSARSGETVYKPLTEDEFAELFLKNPACALAYTLVAEENAGVTGFISGAEKVRFLPGETHENTPGYLTVLLVSPDFRRQGIGTALLAALTRAMARAGKRTVSCSGNNPVALRWLVPGTPGHDHNNAPGVDLDCPGYPFLQKQGFSDRYREAAMYLDLKAYSPPPDLDDKIAALRAAGIDMGRYDIALGYDYDRMCDRVHSEYWRMVLNEEVHAASPRPILAATHEGHLVGFTGPVDQEQSGRGWFSGICTDPFYERRGIATVLFHLLMMEFIAEGAAFSTLFTGCDNPAQRLYRRAGFRVVRHFSIMSRDL